ncbi:DUF3253 domain-containing protein [Marinivivus vitaminiproducens]|uniref:DUF3253 domain-containing protein n=1 Tax=Marinivivus vitaminiproducens TaxID=3035935 RepID=UPI002799B78E|nr:DUF3253 domain-containing protein [Geminicoccaceae bacterium SCSIO 64248]
MTPAALRDLVVAMVRERGAGRTICPSEVARRAAGEDGDWRCLMTQVREAASGLIRDGEIVATQRGRPVDPRSARGPIRLGLAPSDDPRGRPDPDAKG